MATGGSSGSGDQYAMTIRYKEKNKPFYFPGNYTVRKAIAKASSDMTVPFLERPDLVLVHMGSELPPDSTLKDTFRKNKSTCCMLQTSSRNVQSRRTQSQLVADLNNQEDAGKCLGFCTQCESIVRIRPIFACPFCKKRNFVLDGPVNFFEDDHRHIKGHCNDCRKQGKPIIIHECAAKISEQTHIAVFMIHLRQNILDLPCMKCSDKQDEIIKFHCNHTMCRFCFGTMCKFVFENEGFTHDDSIGYSVGCPAGGPHCSAALITDPHHFYLVDGKKDFYKEYQSRAFRAFQENEDNRPKCQKCRNVLDMSCSEQAEVEMPFSMNVQESLPLETGGVWLSFMKKFKKSSSQPSPPKEKKTRQQIKCRNCQSLYCGECSSIWHEGDCIKMSEEQKASANRYEVDRKKAAASEWR